MARTENTLLGGARGKIGELIVKRYPFGEVLSRIPRMDGIIPSEKQLAQQARWAAAAVYYQRVKADPILSLAYTRQLKKKKGYNLPAATNRDFFRPPKVTEINLQHYAGKADQLIAIEAIDDFCVAAIDVMLRDAAGTVLEYGPAWESDRAGRWHYRTKTVAPPGSVTFEAVAKDLPGNEGRRTETWKPAIKLVPPAMAEPGPTVSPIASPPSAPPHFDDSLAG